MAIAADHRNLSPAALENENDRWGQLIAQAWAEANVSTYRPQADEATPFRASQAGKCTREVGYYAAGVVGTPMDLAGTWNTGLGTKIHTWWDEAIVAAAAMAETDVRLEVGYSTNGLLSGAIDAVIGDEAIELKTVGGYKFKIIVGARGSEAGPVYGHKMQLALAVHGLGLQRGTLVYLAKECMQERELAKLLKRDVTEADHWRKFVIAFSFDAAELVPLAEAELRRLKRVNDVLESGRLPERFVPELGNGARVVDPATGRWEARFMDEATGEQVVTNAGSYYGCGYCSYQDRCANDLAAGDPVPVELRERTAS